MNLERESINRKKKSIGNEERENLGKRKAMNLLRWKKREKRVMKFLFFFVFCFFIFVNVGVLILIILNNIFFYFFYFILFNLIFLF